MPKYKYVTRIAEHLKLASLARKEEGGQRITITELSEATLIPYQTIRWYMRGKIEGPNYAVVDSIRRYLNYYYFMSSEGYIHREGESPERGAGWES